MFGDDTGVIGTDVWDPGVLARGNYVDAMALISRRAWRQVGGYRRMPANGWEDYDLWLKFCEAGLEPLRVPEILGRYRKRETSMLRNVTNQAATIKILREDMRVHHPAFRASWPVE